MLIPSCAVKSEAAFAPLILQTPSTQICWPPTVPP